VRNGKFKRGSQPRISKREKKGEVEGKRKSVGNERLMQSCKGEFEERKRKKREEADKTRGVTSCWQGTTR
jgi:hypothetical protein